MNKTAIVSCGCSQEYQDSRYGAGMRVTSPVNAKQVKGLFVVRCSVCLREHDLGTLKGAAENREEPRYERS